MNDITFNIPGKTAWAVSVGRVRSSLLDDATVGEKYMQGAEDFCRSKLINSPARVRSVQSPCSALGTVLRVGNGCLLIQTVYKHPAIGLGPVLLDAFGQNFQIREETKLMFQDATNIVVAVPPEIEEHVVMGKYTLSKEPIELMVVVDGDEIMAKIIGLSPSGFIFESQQYIETRIKPKFMIRGNMKDHTIDGDYIFERMGSDAITCGVSIKPGDRIQAALWQGTIRDLAA